MSTPGTRESLKPLPKKEVVHEKKLLLRGTITQGDWNRKTLRSAFKKQ